MKKYWRSIPPYSFVILIFLFLISLSSIHSQELDELEVGGEDDLESILEEGDQKTDTETSNKPIADDVSHLETEAKDDLESLKEDLGDIILEDPLEEAVKISKIVKETGRKK